MHMVSMAEGFYFYNDIWPLSVSYKVTEQKTCNVTYGFFHFNISILALSNIYLCYKLLFKESANLKIEQK